MTVGDAVQLGGLILAVLAAIGGVIKFIISSQAGGDLVGELRERIDELEEELKTERKLREDDSRAHREDLDMLRREHKGEIDQLQQEVRRLLSDRR